MNYVISLKVSKRFINNKNENMVLLNKFSVGSEFGSRIESLEKSDPVKKLVVSAALCMYSSLQVNFHEYKFARSPPFSK